MLTLLLHPLSWSHVYIPVLPEALLGVLAAPMPFLIGVHNSFVDGTEMDVAPYVVQVTHTPLPQQGEDGGMHPRSWLVCPENIRVYYRCAWHDGPRSSPKSVQLLVVFFRRTRLVKAPGVVGGGLFLGGDCFFYVGSCADWKPRPRLGM